MKKFTEYSLHPDVQRGIEAAGFSECTPVQEQTFEAVFNGRDVTVKSQTGTGKTAAFLISIFQTLMNRRDEETPATSGDTPESGAIEAKPRPQVLVLAPTRELVVQIEEEAQVLGEFLPFKFCSVYGGVGYQKQEEQLADNPDFIIGTPGRLIDFVQNRKIDLRRFEYLVIDEADRMFDMGFYPDIQKILRGMLAPGQRRTFLFSATLGTRVLNIAWEHMNNPVDVEIEPEHITVEAITQVLYHVSRDEKISLLLGLIQKHKPESAIFFTNTKRMAEELSYRLRANNFTAEFIMGDLPQKKRLSIINAVKRKEIRFLVATDVAARGLHIDDLAMVFNYDLPEDSENYVHRIGRTARAGNTGMAISLADEQSVYNLSAIEQFVGLKIPVEPVTEDLLAADHSRGTRFHSEFGYGSRGSDRRPSGGGSRDRGRDSSRERGRDGSRDRSRDGSPNRTRQDNRKSSGADRTAQNQVQPRSEKAARPQDASRRSPGEKLSGNSKAPRGERQDRAARPSGNSGKRNSGAKAASPRAEMTEQERLAYYEQKYGENFGGGRKPRRGSGKTAGSGAQGDSKASKSGARTDKASKTGGRGSRSRSASESGRGTSRPQARPAGKGNASASPLKGASGRSEDNASAKTGSKGGIASFFQRLFGRKED